VYLVPAAAIYVLFHYHEVLVSRSTMAQTSAGVLYSTRHRGICSHVGYDPRDSADGRILLRECLSAPRRLTAG